jgi:hypothetical protein
MPSWPSTFLSLLIGVAGWYYLLYSRAAQRLGGIEASAANARRIRLRRTNGAAMIFLAALIYIGTRAVDPHEHPRVFVAVWIGVMGSLLSVVVLALIDVRLTMRVRVRKQEDPRR